MAQRNVYHTYSHAYSLGTDGSATLAGSPIAHQRPMGRTPIRREKGVYVPRWLVIGVLSVLLVGFLYICGNINEQKAIIRRELDRNGMERLIASQKIDEIDAQLAIACDETRIRSIAVNRLGMQLPSDEQLHGMAVPHVVKEAEWQQAQEGTKKSLFRLLLNTLGL